MDADWYDVLLDPASIAVVGASDSPRGPGGRVMAALVKHRFEGRIYPINPQRESVQGLPCFASIEDVPEPVDVVVIVVPAIGIPSILKACGAAGTKVAIIGSAGFREVGEAGAELERQLGDVIGEFPGMRVIGPNTNGIIACGSRFTASFTPVILEDRFELAHGEVTVVSQSGAIGAWLFGLAQESGFPIGSMINTGNELDISFEEVLAAVTARSSDGHVILGYVEGLNNSTVLIEAARTAMAKSQTIVLLKVGTTAAGAHAAASHTAKLAGEDTVYEGVLHQLGIVRARSMRQLADIGRVAAAYSMGIGRSVTIASQSGGIGIVLTDLVDDNALALAEWTTEWQDRLSESLPAHLSKRNPLDLAGGPFGELDRLEAILRVADENPASELTILAFNGFEGRQHTIAERLIEISTTLVKPIVVVWTGGAAEGRLALNQASVPAFDDPEQCVQAVAAFSSRFYGSVLSDDGIQPSEMLSDDQRELIASALLAGEQTLSEAESRMVLEAYGLTVVAERSVLTAADIERALDDLGQPVVAKLRSPALTHKTEIGGVRINLRSAEEIAEVADTFRGVAARAGLADVEVVLQQQIPSGVEVIMGMSNDAVFGPVVTLGIGGVMAELLADVQIRLPHLTTADVADMVASLKHAAALRGFRGMPRADEEVIGEIVQRFARLVRDWGADCSSIDVNPLMVSNGHPPTIVDALFVLADARLPPRTP